MEFRFHDQPVLPRGFRCAARNCGLKQSEPDLALFVSEVPAAAAAVFTRNAVVGAPIVVGREIIRRGVLRAIVVNSKISNVATGEEGIRRARRMGELAAAELGVPVEQVLMSSTGVIGRQLPIEKIEAGLRGIAAELQGDPIVGARGMMTTDTHPKAVSLQLGDAVVTVVAKGSGMIAPNMATMLAYIFTDAALDAAWLDGALRRVVDDTFNMLSVDTDTSTSDTCAILANGLAGRVPEDAFEAALRAACVRMTEIMARDGEGATKLLRATVRRAASREEARRIARSIAESPLVKTMAFGADPNTGRILMAVGKTRDARVDAARLRVWINGTQVYGDGTTLPFDEMALRKELSGDPVDILVDLGLGDGEATAYGCDLTHGYIDENAAYYSS